ncbi:hypothetical protein [Hymenobacter sp. BT559]|nr:hypothetical protein [Hymenobacter sp. BT559]
MGLALQESPTTPTALSYQQSREEAGLVTQLLGRQVNAALAALA